MAPVTHGTIPPDGRVIMVSGANRGIGLAIARHLHAEGYTLSLGARDADALERATEGLGEERVSRHRYMAGERATHAAWVDETATRHGRVDGLVNNAGVLRNFPWDEPDEEALDEMWGVNVKAPYFLALAAHGHLKAGGQGRIVNVLSNSGLRYAGGVPGYAMSKFAALAMTHVLRHKMWEDGIRVTGLCPGAVETDMSAGVVPFPGHLIQPDTLAAMVSLLLSLPNNAAVAYLPVNYALEATV